MRGPPPLLAARRIRRALRQRREVPDPEFDEVYEGPERALSGTFFSPVSVVLRAVELLGVDASSRVLDLGSGVGKFCIVGAAATGAAFVGFEHRARLVEEARSAAARLGVEGVEFVHATIERAPIEEFDAIYLFNPFEENRWSSSVHMDAEVEISEARFDEDVARAEALLARARPGARVVTYHGFGGVMPQGYRLEVREWQRSGYLDCWRKKGGSPRLRAG